eukprot:7273832-Pyramimonas_sp.AAC.1
MPFFARGQEVASAEMRIMRAKSTAQKKLSSRAHSAGECEKGRRGTRRWRSSGRAPTGRAAAAKRRARRGRSPRCNVTPRAPKQKKSPARGSAARRRRSLCTSALSR